MATINLLDAQSANMIAAGEVVERPASALKELLENALDAHARKIRVDIRDGGRVQIAVTDNGDGIEMEDMPRSVLRHATSKIKTGADIDGVRTLGFRGEALAAIAAVSRLQIVSRRRGADEGYLFEICDGQSKLTEVGCPAGTTVLVEDLFFNTPARRKFLKRDGSEAAACVAAAARLALSHPEVSVEMLVDGTEKFHTTGDGDLYSAIYAIYGRSVAKTMMPVEYYLDGVSVAGFVSTPEAARGSRTMQLFYVNRRFVYSKTLSAAVEEACRSFLPAKRFPAAVLSVSIDPHQTDVNVHPAKTEIKFADEKKVFSAVYYGVKNSLACLQTPAPSAAPAPAPAPAPVAAPLRETVPPSGTSDTAAEPAPNPAPPSAGPYTVFSAADVTSPDELYDEGTEDLPLASPPTGRAYDGPLPGLGAPPEPSMPADPSAAAEPSVLPELSALPAYRYVGELYDAFLIAETLDTVYIIDKHALHERILYEKLASNKETNAQWLLSGIPVTLTDEQARVLEENAELLSEYGFVIEPFGDGVIVRAVPGALVNTAGLPALLENFAADLTNGNAIPFSVRCDRALFTVACKAALKAGVHNAPAHNEWLIDRFFESSTVRYCPHGRPVSHALPKREIEKYFDR